MIVVLALKLTRMDSLKRFHMKDIINIVFCSGCHLPAIVMNFYLGLMVNFNSFFSPIVLLFTNIFFNCLMSILPVKGEIKSP